MNQAGRDQNHVTTLIALSSVDGETPVTLWADPITHELLVSTSGAGDVVGPATSTDGVPALFDGTTGKLLKNSTPTGTGNPVMHNSPTLVTPALGTPSALVGTNITGTASGLTAGSLTNATLTTALTVDTGTVGLTGNAAGSVLTLGAGASSVSGSNTGDQTNISGNAGTVTNGVYTTDNLSVMAATTSLQLKGVISDETGSGSLVFGTSPTLNDPVLDNDLLINSGGVINFNSGETTITHAAGKLTLAGTGADFQFGGEVSPTTSAGQDLGKTSLQWGSLHLSSIINFGNGGVVLTRAAGVLTVSPGDLRVTTAGTNTASVVTVGGTQTLTNKQITKRLVTTTDDATAVIDVTITDVYELSAVANATTFSFTGTPTDGQTIIIRFKDAGTTKGLTWTGFTAIGVTLPTTTTVSKWHYVGVQYNSAATQWHAIAVTEEA